MARDTFSGSCGSSGGGALLVLTAQKLRAGSERERA
jgi:hypothetical protein